MLNPFPILFLAPLAYFVLRIVLGFVCIRLGKQMLRNSTGSGKRKVLGALFIGAGLLLFIGLYTQIAALVILTFAVFGIIRRGTIEELTRMTLLLMATIALSLFITGAGSFAFDLPI